jgi:hypothetical protein
MPDMAAKVPQPISKDVPCRPSVCKETKTFKTNNNWKTALFLFA